MVMLGGSFLGLGATAGGLLGSPCWATKGGGSWMSVTGEELGEGAAGRRIWTTGMASGAFFMDAFFFNFCSSL